jgi:hypothetical protein
MGITSPRRGLRLRSSRRATIATVFLLGAFAAATGSAQAATLSITHRIDPAGDTTPATYLIAFAPHPHTNDVTTVPPQVTLAGGETKTFTNIQKGFYTITEQTPAGYRLVNISCVATPPDPDPKDAFVINVGAGWARVELSSDENKGCTFTDVRTPEPPPPPPGPPGPPTPPGPPGTPPGTPPGAPPPGSPATPPATGVTPVTLLQGSAKLSAPTRCASHRFTVTVTGSRVQSVTWRVNGKTAKTVRARKGQRRFSITLSPTGAQRIVARVLFTAGTTPRAKSLRATVRGCSPGAIRPQFTG